MSEPDNTRPQPTPPPLVPPADLKPRPEVSDTELRELGHTGDVDGAERSDHDERNAAGARDAGVEQDRGTEAVHSVAQDRSTERDAAAERPSADAPLFVEPGAHSGDQHVDARGSSSVPLSEESEHGAHASTPAQASASEALPDSAPVEPTAEREATDRREATDGDETQAYVPGAAYAAAPVVSEHPTAAAERPQFGEQPAQPQQRVFMAAPVAPKKRGNRGIGSLIALLSVIIFAAIYLGIGALLISVQAPGQQIDRYLLEFMASRLFWVPAILYVVAFVLVVLVVNRANWWAYVLGSLIIGLAVYFGTIAIGLLSENVVGMTGAQARGRFAVYALNPYVIAAAFVAREVSIWTGTAISARGRRMKLRNSRARDEFDRATEQHRTEYERGYA